MTNEMILTLKSPDFHTTVVIFRNHYSITSSYVKCKPNPKIKFPLLFFLLVNERIVAIGWTSSNLSKSLFNNIILCQMQRIATICNTYDHWLEQTKLLLIAFTNRKYPRQILTGKIKLIIHRINNSNNEHKLPVKRTLDTILN